MLKLILLHNYIIPDPVRSKSNETRFQFIRSAIYTLMQKNYQCYKLLTTPETWSTSIVAAKCHPGTNALNPSKFLYIFKKHMKVEDATTTGDFYDDFRFLEI